MLQPPDTANVSSSYVPPVDPIAPLRAALRGHYDIEREIGQGAFATVYLARDLKHERKVALKVLNADPASDTGELRFIREIRTLARLQHPNILPLHDSGHVEALLYYVMPYVSGDTLRDRIDREKQMSIDAACSIAREVADGLSYAHAQGVIHRDIKPENILLSTGHPIIADFGIARAIDLAGVRQITKTGAQSPGTPAYMSPEQLLGEKGVDGRSDIYSLGCVLFEMLTGKPPFAGKEGFVKRFTEPPPKASTLRKDLPGWLDEAIAVALEREPQDRYATPKEFVAALCPPAGSDESARISDSSRRRATPRGSHAGYADAAVDSQPSRERAGSPLDEAPASVDVQRDVRPGRWRAMIASVGSHPKTAAGVLVGLVAAALALSAIGGSSRVFAALGVGVPLDTARFAVLPFSGSERVGAQVAANLYDQFSEWQGLPLVPDTRVAQALKEKGSPTTESEAIALGRTLGAGKVIWGTASESGGAAHVRVHRYDVKSRDSEDDFAFDDTKPNPANYSLVANRLLGARERPIAAKGCDGGTRSFPAWSACSRGHVELKAFDIAGAEREFNAAVVADPDYAAARLWLAQTRFLRSYNPVDAWREHVVRAVSVPGSLNPRDSLLASALSSMAASDFGSACTSYRKLVTDDRGDFLGWYGLGFCGLADRTVLADPQHRGRWRFRSSYLSAAQAFDKATQLEPRLFSVLPFDKMLLVAPIQAVQLRVGIAAGKPKDVFLAYPSVNADTLAFTPFPLADVQRNLPGTAPPTGGLAAQQSRAFLLRFVRRWIREFPQSPDAYEALSVLQEAGGELRNDRGDVPSALTAVLKAERLASDPERHALLVFREVRLRLKGEEFERARALSDSLLASGNAVPAGSVDLVGLAALTGRLTLTQHLVRPVSILPGSYDLSSLPNDAVMSIANSLYVRAALGACSEDFDRLATQLDSLFQSYVPLPQQQATREALTARSWSMAVPCRPAFALRVKSPTDQLLRMQQAFARSQPSVVRAQFDSLARLRETDRPGDVSPDATYQEAWLLAAIGDTTAAIRKLDLSLSALPTLGNLILDDAPQAAGLVRAMILRADLAVARGDVTTARKWSRAASILWSNADPSLQPVVRRMRSIAQQRGSPAGPNPSSRR